MNYETVVDQICHCMVSEKKLHQPTFLPLANEVWGKVMFLQMSVCPQGGICLWVWGDVYRWVQIGVPLDLGVSLWIQGCVCAYTLDTHTHPGHTHTPWTHTIGHTPWAYTPEHPWTPPPPTVHKWALGHPTVMLSCFYKHETTSYLRHFPRPHFLN